MKIYYYFIILFFSVAVNAQNDMTCVKDITPVYLHKDVTTHFYSYQNIEYSDLSTSHVVGQLAKPNILAIKPLNEPFDDMDGFGVLTILGESYMKQYKLNYTNDIKRANTEVFIDNKNKATSLVNSENVTSQEMKLMANKLVKQTPEYNGVSTKGYGLTIRLNNIITKANVIFVDYTMTNDTNLRYDIDQIRYKVEDNKITRASNIQSVETIPVYNYYSKPYFKNKMRNVVVFNKFTFPDNKILNIEATEINSGRKIVLHISYKDLLKADIP